MSKEDIEKARLWYLQKQPLYKLLAEEVKRILKEVLDTEKVNYVNIESRAKDVNSFVNKLEKGVPFKPEDMQDLAGIRIISYVKSDADKTNNTIKNLFDIDETRTTDKSKFLGTDKVGYRSLHFVCKLPSSRMQFPEYKKFENMYFEIQVRTVLQHAWAEIQHDRNYKFSGILPSEIKRKFHLVAGILELADNEFDNISKQIEDYSNTVSEKTKVGELNISIDSTSLRSYLNDKFSDVNNVENVFGPKDDYSEILINELKDMRITTLQQLEDIIPIDFKENQIKYGKETNFAGLLRTIMIIHDADRYFTDSWKSHWNTFDDDDENLYERYGIDSKKLSKKYNIDPTNILI